MERVGTSDHGEVDKDGKSNHEARGDYDSSNDDGILEVLKRKACSTLEGNNTKKLKALDTSNLDLEFIEVNPEDSSWMTGEASEIADLNKDWKVQDSAEGGAKKGDNLLSLISIIAARNAITGAASQEELPTNVSESLCKNQWQLYLKPEYFMSVKDSDIVRWSGEGSMSEIICDQKAAPKKNKKSKKFTSECSWMLNPSRNICAFVHTDTVLGKSKSTYYCNFCKLTESTYGGFYQHLNHHLFVCGECAYHSSCRLDVEIHRERVSHMTSLSQGYLAHKQKDSLVSKCKKNAVSESPSLLDWQTIQEETEALIIIQSSFFPESAEQAYERARPDQEKADTNGPVNLVCALPYHRYVSQKSCRKNVLEYHCNFCQSTPIYTQELYRHVDFHSFTCKEPNCEFQSFTNVELFLHQRNSHWQKYKSFLEKLIIFMPQTFAKEEEFVAMAAGQNNWSIVLNLPRSTTPDTSQPPTGTLLKKEREWRCRVCNNFVINKGGLTTHLVLLHNVNPKEVHLYMEPMQ